MPAPKPTRLAWIDLLRGVAVIGMIETHVVNTLLSAEYDGAGWRHELGFYNGLLAPAFFWIAGYLQGLSIRKAQRENRPILTGPRLRRLGLVAFLGYYLHAPWGHWLAGDFGAESWHIALQADVLQCLVASLALLLLAGLARGWWFDAVTFLLTAFFVFAAPASAHWQTGVPLIDPFLNHESGSLFPLFPWVGFCTVGSLASRWEISWQSLLPASLLFIAIGTVFGPESGRYLHPAFFAERLGWLGLLVAAVWLAGQRFAPAWILLAGRESLLIYMAHLIILHSVKIGGVTIDRLIGRTLSFPLAFLAFLALLGLSLLLAWANDRWKRHRRKSAVAPAEHA